MVASHVMILIEMMLNRLVVDNNKLFCQIMIPIYVYLCCACDFDRVDIEQVGKKDELFCQIMIPIYIYLCCACDFGVDGNFYLVITFSLSYEFIAIMDENDVSC